jgi:hypothetical protein
MMSCARSTPMERLLLAPTIAVSCLKLAEMFPPTSVIGVIWIIRAIDHGGDPDLREAVRFLELEKQSNGEVELSSYSRIRKWMDSVTGVEFDGISIEKAGRLVYIRRVGD